MKPFRNLFLFLKCRKSPFIQMVFPAVLLPVVIALLLVTLAVVGFLLYRYLCHNKGAYRTTGEPAPGEDLAEDHKPNQAPNDKKEYFI